MQVFTMVITELINDCYKIVTLHFPSQKYQYNTISHQLTLVLATNVNFCCRDNGVLAWRCSCMELKKPYFNFRFVAYCYIIIMS